MSRGLFDREGTPGDVVAYALGLEDQPSLGHHYQCPGCERPVRSLEYDGYCRRCTTGEDEYDPACVARANAKIMGRWGRR